MRCCCCGVKLRIPYISPRSRITLTPLILRRLLLELLVQRQRLRCLTTTRIIIHNVHARRRAVFLAATRTLPRRLLLRARIRCRLPLRSSRFLLLLFPFAARKFHLLLLALAAAHGCLLRRNAISRLHEFRHRIPRPPPLRNRVRGSLGESIPIPTIRRSTRMLISSQLRRAVGVLSLGCVVDVMVVVVRILRLELRLLGCARIAVGVVVVVVCEVGGMLWVVACCLRHRGGWCRCLDARTRIYALLWQIV